MNKIKAILNKLWIYIRPFLNWRFLVSYLLPFCIINGWAWVGAALMTVWGPNWFTTAATAWLAFLWLPTTPEKLITIPMAIIIHTKLFGKRDPKTREQLEEMLATAKADWKAVKSRIKNFFTRGNK